MKKINSCFYALVLMVCAFALTSCGNDSIDIPDVGDSVATVQQKLANVAKDIEKDDYPGIWIVDDHNLLIQFENGVVKHVIWGGEKDRIDQILFNRGIKRGDGDYQYFTSPLTNEGVYYINKTMTAYAVFVPLDEGQKIKAALSSGSNEYNTPETIVTNEDAVDDISYSVWHYIFKILYWLS